MKKYWYDGTTYNTLNEARDAAVEDFDAHYDDIMRDYFDDNPKVCMSMLNELAHAGSPLWEEIVDNAWGEYVENTIEEFDADEEMEYL